MPHEKYKLRRHHERPEGELSSVGLRSVAWMVRVSSGANTTIWARSPQRAPWPPPTPPAWKQCRCPSKGRFEISAKSRISNRPRASGNRNAASNLRQGTFVTRRLAVHRVQVGPDSLWQNYGKSAGWLCRKCKREPSGEKVTSFLPRVYIE